MVAATFTITVAVAIEMVGGNYGLRLQQFLQFGVIFTICGRPLGVINYCCYSSSSAFSYQHDYAKENECVWWMLLSIECKHPLFFEYFPSDIITVVIFLHYHWANHYHHDGIHYLLFQVHYYCHHYRHKHHHHHPPLHYSQQHQTPK